MKIEKLENGQFARIDVVEYLTIEGIEAQIKQREQDIESIKAMIESDKKILEVLLNM